MMIRKRTKRSIAVLILVFVMLSVSIIGTLPPEWANAAAQTPELLLTEIVPASSGANQAYEFVEVYNNSSQPIDLDKYKLRYFTVPSDYIDWPISQKTIQPRSTLVLWLKKYLNQNDPTAPNALADFNDNYGVALTQNQVFEVMLKTSGQGMHDSAKRGLAIMDPNGRLVVSATINDGVTDGITDKSVSYQYPAPNTTEMRKLANNQKATPGRLVAGQIPGPSGVTGLTCMPGDESVTLAWDGEPSGLIRYKVYQEGAADPFTVTGNTYAVTELTNMTAYSFRVTAIDANGDESPATSVVTCYPQLVPDLTAPGAPTEITAVTGMGSVKIGWAPGTEADIAGYRVYKNGRLTQTVSATSYQTIVGSLIPGKAYRFEVAAFDRVNNESAKSDPVRAVPDLKPVPGLLITELVPDTDNHFSGYDAFEFMELYNTGSDPIDLNGYTVKVDGSWQQTIHGPAVAYPKQTFVIWTRKAELSSMTKDEFNMYYYATYKDKYIPETSMYIVEGVSGLINSGKQTVMLLDPSGKETARAVYNDNGSDVSVNSSIVYSYPIDGGTVMRKLASKVAATPGQLIRDQAPSQQGGDLQPPTVPTGVSAVPGDGFAKLNWSPVTDSDLAAYRIYKNGQLELTVRADKTEATIAGLTGNKPYTFEIASVDRFDNVSGTSVPVTVVPRHEKLTQTDRSKPIDKSVSPLFWNLSEPGLVIPGLAEDTVPQGIAYDKQRDWFIISSYRNDDRPSMLSIVDAKSNVLLKSLNVYQENHAPYVGHAGGVSVSRSSVWIASGGAMYRIPMSAIEAAADQGEVAIADRFMTNTRASLSAYHDGVLWVGEYYESPGYLTDISHKMTNRENQESNAWLSGYVLDPDTDKVTADKPVVDNAVVPDFILSMTDQIQGAEFWEDQIVLSQSVSRAVTSKLFRYNNPLKEAPHTTVTIGQKTVPVWFLDKQSAPQDNATLESPPLTEGIVNRNGKLQVLFESGSNPYRATTLQSLDRVQQLDLKAWEQYDTISIQGVPAEMYPGTEAQLSVVQRKGNNPLVDVTAWAIFASSNPASAEISVQGAFKAAAAGDTVITATYGGKKATVALTVTERPLIIEKITVAGPNNFMSAGETAQLQVMAHYTNGMSADVTAFAVFYSTKPDKAEVNAKGLVTAKHPGQTVLSASYGGMTSTGAKIIVRGKPEKNGRNDEETDES